MPTKLDLYSTLNKQQAIAAEHVDGPILVLAGAGSGKTRVLTYRIANLVINHGVNPASILAITFTNKATDEMHHRLGSILGSDVYKLWVSTFHAAGLKIIRNHFNLLGLEQNIVVYDTDDCADTMRNILKELKLNEKKARQFCQEIDRAKNKLISAEKFKSVGFGERLTREIYEKYQRALLSSNAVDFGDLLVYPVELFTSHPEVLKIYAQGIRYILVDEFQDTNHAQYTLLKLLTTIHKNLFVVGDDDQSIYGFRGAEIQNIINFPSVYEGAKVVRLEQNYRSTKTILTTANNIIASNLGRSDKKLWTQNPTGDCVTIYQADDELEEAGYIASKIEKLKASGGRLNEIAIFYRTNAQSRAIEEALVSKGITYRIFGALRFFDRKEIKDIVSYLRLIVNPNDAQAFARIINTPPRGIGPQAVEEIRKSCVAHQLSPLAATRKIVAESGGDVITRTKRPTKRSEGFTGFCELIDTLSLVATQEPLSNLVLQTAKLSGYEDALKKLNTEEAESRLQNIYELAAIAEQFTASNKNSQTPTVTDFLARISLATSQENSGTADDYVSLMTLHLAKGLEFNTVFFSGFEEGLVPHARSFEMEREMEEERRLCYVGVTRAMKKLFITHCENRGLSSASGGYGNFSYYRMPSRFLQDIPEECVTSM